MRFDVLVSRIRGIVVAILIRARGRGVVESKMRFDVQVSVSSVNHGTPSTLHCY